jgi:folate-binding Fe-S cluster repair protein YgfZ/Tfp pilus assembly protein PilF
MSVQELKTKRYVPALISTKDEWAVLRLDGEDTQRFLQGQTTNDLSGVVEQSGVMNARIDRSGKIQSIFYTLRTADCWYLVIDKSFADSLQNELNKFIIMDDVELSVYATDVRFYVYPQKIQEKNYFEVSLAGVPGVITFGEQLEVHEELTISESGLLGFPIFGLNWTNEQLITDSFLHKEVISLTKGCFLGQEVVAKILNNRGSAVHPALIEESFLEGSDVHNAEGEKIGKVTCSLSSDFSIVAISRKYAVKNRKLTVKTEKRLRETIPSYLPLFEKKSSKELSEELFEFASEVFRYDEDDAARWFERAIEIDPENQDACESLGVCLGRMGLFERGIELMDKLLKLNPDSVMAHTNKSLFLMKLGKIEEAEEEKSLATVAGFKQLGAESRQKKNQEEQSKRESEELERKKDMFLQVLEIDNDDIIANFGLGEYSYKVRDYEKAIGYLEKTLTLDPKYSRAYLILGKSLIGANKKDQAIKIFNEGIEVATTKGELMPANEMQEQLSHLQ